MNIIEAHNVSKAFTNHIALDNVSITIPRGQVYGLLGPNGAGKTTFIRIINHITAPDSGTVTFDGHPLTAADIVNIGYLPEERGLYKKMKVGEQAMFFARLKGLSKEDAKRSLEQWFERLEISSWWNRKVEELSKGMAQKVQFIITVLHKPKLLIFDEPFSGFDPINVNTLKNEILHLRDEGATVIFSTHNMSSVEELCDNITLINRSHNILSGSVKEIREKYSGHKYEISFIGNDNDVSEALTPVVEKISPISIDKMGKSTLSIELASRDDLREVISRANNATTLVSVTPKLLSMDDIFIRTVESFNAMQQSMQSNAPIKA